MREELGVNFWEEGAVSFYLGPIGRYKVVIPHRGKPTAQPAVLSKRSAPSSFMTLSVFLYFCKQFFYHAILDLSAKHKRLLLAFVQSVLRCFHLIMYRNCSSLASLPNLLTNVLFPKGRSLASWPLPGNFLASCPPGNTFLGLFSVFLSLTPSYSHRWVILLLRCIVWSH